MPKPTMAGKATAGTGPAELLDDSKDDRCRQGDDDDRVVHGYASSNE
jgi:hypothetical protein